jgi:hypothetical protein
MKELKSILGLLVLLVGGFVLYKVLPVYWGDYKLDRLLEEQALFYTYNAKPDAEIAKIVAQKACDIDVPLTAEDIKVDRTAAELSIVATYSVHVDLPIHPLDLRFTTGTHNKNVMK